ncbi:MAG: NAD(P)/FAD-dependent oxidoreductase [Haloarculaceae archaeon]
MDAADRLPRAVDVTVVGGGVIGTGTAYFLSTTTDLDVVLLERDAVAAGSTGDSSAIIRHIYGDRDIYSRMAAWSHEFYRNFEDETGESIAYEPNPLVRMGREGEPSGDVAQAGYDVLSGLDVSVSRYERDELPDRYPMLALDDVDFAVSDDDAAYSDATDVAGGFARAAQAAGATVVTGVEVEDVVVDDDSVTGVDTDAGTVSTDDVVVAAGPWTPQLADSVGVEIPIQPSREQILLLDPPADFVAESLEDLPTTSEPGSDWYMRPDFGDGVLIATHHSGDAVDPDTYKPDPDEDVVLDLVDDLSAFVPDLADARLRGQYCGVYSETPDRDFVLDQAGPSGCYFACGFSGHGFKQAPAVGTMMTDLVVDGDSDVADLEYFSLDRFADDPNGHAAAGDP